MTGRDLIIYIIENNLYDKDIFKDDEFFKFLNIDCMTVKEAALKNNVGIETIHAWCTLGKMKSININGTIYILTNRSER